MVMFFLPKLLIGQFYYEIGDTLTITAKSGLNMRDSASIISNKLSKIQFGEKVIAKNLPKNRDEFDGITGSWIEIEYNGEKGYVFSGFVTKAKIPKYDREIYCNYNAPTWWEELIRLNVDSIQCKGKRRYKGFDPDKGGGISEWELYSNETIIYHSYGYEMMDLIVETNELNMNDLLNLLEYFISENDDCNSSYFYPERKKYLKIKTQKEKYGCSNRIKRIECETIGFHAEQTINKTIFRINIEGL